MCSEASTSLSSILPVLFSVIKHPEVKENDSVVIKRFKLCVERQIRTRWGLDEIDATDISVLASALDPRYKTLKLKKYLKSKLNYKTRSVNLHLMESPTAVPHPQLHKMYHLQQRRRP